MSETSTRWLQPPFLDDEHRDAGHSATALMSRPPLSRELATAEHEVAALQARFLPDVQSWLRDAIPRSEQGLSRMLRYHLGWEDADGIAGPSSGGKAVRPVLCLTACELAGGDWHRALPAAAALELVHNFSLIHDDILDGDVLRRGRETLWKVWGVPAALAAGNAMRVIADRTLARLEDAGVPGASVAEASAELTRGYLEMLEGQHLDVALELRSDVTVAEYLDMICRKTGALFATAMFLGALVATDDPETAHAFGACGRMMGMAFQVRDDYLGVWGDPYTTLKPAADIKRKKKSLPIVYMLEHAHADDRAWLDEAYADDQISGPNVERILDLLERLNARQYVQRTAQATASGALATDTGLCLTHEQRRVLQAIACYFVTREK